MNSIFFFFLKRNYRVKTSDLSLELMNDPAPRRHGDSRPTAVMKNPHAGLLPFLLSTLSSVTRR